MATLVVNPLLHDLTFIACASRGDPPLYVGATVAFRFQLLDSAGAAVSLSGATIAAIFSDGTNTVTRLSTVEISGGIYEIKIDTDQSTVTGDTGKGWYQLNFLPAETAMSSLVGLRRSYKVKITQGSGVVIYPHFAGRIDIGS